jgi:hypothetical protein
MALGDTNINTTNVGAEIGSSSNSVTGLVGNGALNKFSRYAPGTLGVDASKNITLTPPTSDYKLGEFRRYSHTTAKPTFQILSAQTHYSGTTTMTIVQPIAMNELNLQMFPSNGINTGVTPNQYHLRINMYSSSTDRTNESNVLQTFYPIAVNMVAHTPLTGHSRQPSYVMNTGASGNLITLTNVNCGSGTVTRYFDFFFCDQFGSNRLVNFGNKSDGYVDIEFREYVNPYLQGGATVTAPAGTTAAFPELHTASSPKCAVTNNVNMTQGSSSYTFYMGMHVISGANTYLYSTTASVNVRMTRVHPTLGSENKIIASNIAFANNAKTQFTSTLSGWTTLGNTWNYDEVVTISVESANWATSWGTGLICP